MSWGRGLAEDFHGTVYPWCLAARYPSPLASTKPKSWKRQRGLLLTRWGGGKHRERKDRRGAECQCLWQVSTGQRGSAWRMVLPERRQIWSRLRHLMDQFRGWSGQTFLNQQLREEETQGGREGSSVWRCWVWALACRRAGAHRSYRRAGPTKPGRHVADLSWTLSS